MRRTEPGMSPFWDYIGMEEVEMSEGYAEIKMIIKPEHTQRRGTVHGGVLATLIDAAVGSAVRTTQTEDQSSATIELKINYIRPAKGDYLLAKGKLSHRGKKVQVGTAEIFNSEGKMVAMGSATFMVIS
ncbi:PaaI family thioesterase [Halalkalibacter krulwichiae]|nr:PaaI family thioesterase [Halalkalibacter krulwichiae]